MKWDESYENWWGEIEDAKGEKDFDEKKSKQKKIENTNCSRTLRSAVPTPATCRRYSHFRHQRSTPRLPCLLPPVVISHRVRYRRSLETRTIVQRSVSLNLFHSSIDKTKRIIANHDHDHQSSTVLRYSVSNLRPSGRAYGEPQ